MMATFSHCPLESTPDFPRISKFAIFGESFAIAAAANKRCSIISAASEILQMIPGNVSHDLSKNWWKTGLFWTLN